MFGGKSTPYIFNLFAEALHWIIECHIPTSLHHYLDNFLPIFKPEVPTHIANVAVAWIENLGKSLGLSFQPTKTICPTMCIEFLGLELDSAAMEAHLPQDKLIYLRSYIVDWQSRSCCSLKDLQELIGFLQFCVQVIPHGRTFIRGLINFSMMFKSDFMCRHIPAYVCADMRWWLSLLRSITPL